VNNRLLEALKCQNKGRPPVWLMRQAGRYMPEYSALRKKHTFLDICHQSELIVQTTLLPIELLNVDAAIIFSDLLLLAQPLGFNLVYDEGIGPLIDPVIRDPSGIPKIRSGAIENKLAPLFEAISILRKQLKVPLLGFAGAPFTLASYLIEGKTNRELRYTKQWMLSDPESFHQLLDRLSEATAQLLMLQIEAGVQAVQLFDSWAMALSPEHFRIFALPYMDKVRQKLPPGFPVIYFSRGAHGSSLAQAHPTAISVDWTVDLPQLRKQFPTKIAVQGNLDPSWLYAPQEKLKVAVNELLNSMKDDPGYIFNLGHGIPPDVPFSNVQYLVSLLN